ncbi:hypothetical protein G7068_08505 [Leucobacter viscericola]|uniref:Uncharacterized protein n=1 Tax=Leucobacter viscericola TaxID=2714935 RepID=A0A6G7XF62_9MICO|nr:hypothetical protein [Leucobacter viscericola]QIK63234.1 hypothetical protein G7068_08505 [Leucobacter viscericola]
MVSQPKHYGPLTFADGFLLIGDPLGAHARITQEGISSFEQNNLIEEFEWAAVGSVQLTLAQSQFRYTAQAWDLLAAVIALISAENPTLSPSDHGTLSVGVAGENKQIAVGMPRLGTYWAKEVNSVQRFLDHMLNSPEERELIDSPDSLRDWLREATRSAS